MKIEELHDHLFDLLCIIDDIAKGNHLNYYLNGGTELGAVREKNFIPWDDDADIMVMREDYDLFAKTMKEYLPPQVKIVEPTEFSPSFYDFLTRIVDTRYKLRAETEEEKAYKNIQNYVGVDVFIFDKAPNTLIQRKILLLKKKIIYGLAMSKRYKLNYSKYSMLEKVLIKILVSFGSHISIDSIFDMHQKFSRLYSDKLCNYRFSSNSSLNDSIFYKEEWFNNAVSATLRERQFPVPVGYHEELTAHYGDYLVPTQTPNKYIRHLDKQEIDKIDNKYFRQ